MLYNLASSWVDAMSNYLTHDIQASAHMKPTDWFLHAATWRGLPYRLVGLGNWILPTSISL
jgi:hypothetical protein